MSTEPRWHVRRTSTWDLQGQATYSEDGWEPFAVDRGWICWRKLIQPAGDQ